MKVLKVVIADDHTKLLAESKEMSEKAIATSATSRLEFITVSVLLILSKSAGLDEVQPAERMFSSKFRLRREEHMHAMVLKKRTEMWK